MNMHEDAIVTWIRSSYLANSSYVEDLYESYLVDPNSVSLEWRAVFSELGARRAMNSLMRRFVSACVRKSHSPTCSQCCAGNAALDQKQFPCITAHQCLSLRRPSAQLDPLGLTTNPVVPELELSYYQLETTDLDREFHIGSFSVANQERMTLRDLLESLTKTYCDVIGAEFMHMTSQLEKRWIQERLEPADARRKWTAEAIKDRLWRN